MNEQTRYVEIFDPFNGSWHKFPLSAIRKGDWFHLYEEDGYYINGGKATKDAYLNEHDIWTIEYEVI